MKKYLLMAAALVWGSAMFTSCEKDDDEKEKIAVVNFEGEGFTSLIDNPQYGGALIYSAEPYAWVDEKTTLSSSCEKEDWTQWGMGYGWHNGIAISNYVDADETAGYQKQLSVPVGNGSNNFAVVWDNESAIAFADGTAHVLKSMDVCLTTYTYNNVKKNLGEGYEFKAVATGTKADGTTSTLDIILAHGDNAVSNWTKVDLSALGAVTSVSFTFEGSDMSGYGGGLATPKYFAFDNVVVKL